MLSKDYLGVVVMTCRNGLKLSRECLRTLLAQTEQPLLVLVVDNASSDGTAGWLRGEVVKDPRVRGASFEEPVSVAEMWNKALNWCWAQGFDQAMVVNNDTEFLPETYLFLSEYMYRMREEHRVDMVTAIGVRERAQFKIGDSGEFSPRDHPDYSAFLLRKSAHLQVPFDEECKGAYVEDLIHHVEMHRAGMRAVSIDLPFLHHKSGTIRSADVKERRRIEACAQGNREYFERKYGCHPNSKAYQGLFT